MKLIWIAMWIGVMSVMNHLGLSTGWVLGIGIAGFVLELIAAIIKAIADNM